MTRAQAVGCALLSLSLLNGCPAPTTPDPPAALPGMSFAQADWQYIRVDDHRGKWGDFDPPEWLRYFGLAVGDLTGDGYPDIVSGRYFYRNPGGDLSGDWVRRDLGRNLDAILITDVDGDEHADLIAQALPDILWVEATDGLGNRWTVRKVAQAPKTGHVNSQGFALGQLVPGGKPELVLASGDGIYYYEIPEDPAALSGQTGTAQWPQVRVTADASDEGLDIGDIDGDGLADLVASKGSDYVAWWRNPGRPGGDWSRRIIGTTEPHDADRVKAADIDGDGKTDVVVTEERVPGDAPDANLYWFRQPEDPAAGDWPRQRLLTEYSLNSLDAADVEGDGDVDLVVAEHKGPHLRLQLLENDGQGRFLVREIDRGKENHLGALVADLDRDGDPDIVGIAWDRYPDLHLWRNDRPRPGNPVCWKPLSNLAGAFPQAGVGQQSSALVFDVDRDGRDDFVIAGWAPERSMVWFRATPKGFERLLIDDRQSHIEAGGAAFDIDGDGDLDIVQGGSWMTNQVWWWENPAPDYLPTRPWPRHTIKDRGAKQHHDQIIGDFDGDGGAELAFWNQQARTLFLADIPDTPRDRAAWKLQPIWTWTEGPGYEGLAAADVDLDGTLDLIGGGRWLKQIGGTQFEARVIDPSYGISRAAVGDFVEGGRPEILLASGDGEGPLNLYQWRDGVWERSALVAHQDHGHTLQTGDIDGDGHLDIYTAAMHTPGAGAAARQIVLYGDGRGQFQTQTISTGIGTHEGKLGDLDGDGDLDILQKDFQHEQRIDVWLNEGRTPCAE